MVKKLGIVFLGALLVCASSMNNGFAAEKIRERLRDLYA